jgi:hypothetical protein
VHLTLPFCFWYSFGRVFSLQRKGLVRIRLIARFKFFFSFLNWLLLCVVLAKQFQFDLGIALNVALCYSCQIECATAANLSRPRIPGCATQVGIVFGCFRLLLEVWTERKILLRPEGHLTSPPEGHLTSGQELEHFVLDTPAPHSPDTVLNSQLASSAGCTVGCAAGYKAACYSTKFSFLLMWGSFSFPLYFFRVFTSVEFFVLGIYRRFVHGWAHFRLATVVFDDTIVFWSDLASKPLPHNQWRATFSNHILDLFFALWSVMVSCEFPTFSNGLKSRESIDIKVHAYIFCDKIFKSGCLIISPNR